MGTPHVDRKQYLKIFAALLILTVLEVGVVYVPGIAKVPLGIALCSMALTKAALVGWFFMHLGHETKPLKLTVAVPFAFPAAYAFALILDAVARFAVNG